MNDLYSPAAMSMNLVMRRVNYQSYHYLLLTKGTTCSFSFHICGDSGEGTTVSWGGHDACTCWLAFLFASSTNFSVTHTFSKISPFSFLCFNNFLFKISRRFQQIYYFATKFLIGLASSVKAERRRNRLEQSQYRWLPFVASSIFCFSFVKCDLRALLDANSFVNTRGKFLKPPTVGQLKANNRSTHNQQVFWGALPRNSHKRQPSGHVCGAHFRVATDTVQTVYRLYFLGGTK